MRAARAVDQWVVQWRQAVARQSHRILHNLAGVILLALMALYRIKTTEKFRGHAPGEFGKLLGLDRAPEVRCLRYKMDELSADDGAERWAALLGKYWMEQESESAPFTLTVMCVFVSSRANWRSAKFSSVV